MTREAFTLGSRLMRSHSDTKRFTHTGKEAQAWAELDLLAAEIGARWPEGVSAAEAVAEVRR